MSIEGVNEHLKVGDRYMWSEHLVVIVGFRLWGISKIYKIYTNIYKIYTKYQAAAAQPGSEARPWSGKNRVLF